MREYRIDWEEEEIEKLADRLETGLTGRFGAADFRGATKQADMGYLIEGERERRLRNSLIASAVLFSAGALLATLGDNYNEYIPSAVSGIAGFGAFINSYRFL
ncbi:MAG TPA: hypothetical protein VJH95_02060 [Candidatus Nanoarchaeia archaeon]|nr:hypothetical protein [Candidatus Nanoarchaeia archaeon]